MTCPWRSRRGYGLISGLTAIFAARRYVERDTNQPSNVGLPTKNPFEVGRTFGTLTGAIRNSLFTYAWLQRLAFSGRRPKTD
jgi:hypothetical protein